MKAIASIIFFSCLLGFSYAQQLFRRELVYTVNGKTCKDYLVYDASIKGKRPAILVIPEWWGCNSYAQYRADMLAGLGYIAMAVDMYGNGSQADNPEDAKKLAGPFYANPELGFNRIEAAINKLSESPETDTEKMAGIGYCFGGSMLLRASGQGIQLKGIVAFHAGLSGVAVKKGRNMPKILVCHGEADSFVSKDEVVSFRKNLDDAGVAYTFIGYPGATHAFTNPASSDNGHRFNMPIAYNATADKQSWEAMREFLKGTLGK